MDTDGAVAIVGMACRYPGCDTLDEFWRILVNGENHIQEVTPDRWNVEAFFDPNFETPGKTYAKWAGLIDNAFEWDNVVFNVNEMEAEMMDPQQKLALEVSHRALENAGIPLQDIRGANMAVYMCQMNADYAHQTATDIASWTNYEFTGTSPCILANRISYTFDLRGPSVTLDTACSGSMVAVHLGAQSILSGESNLALCGGSNFIISPATFIALSKSRMASPTGQCRAFSADADGYVKAEGCGVLVLKNLKQALSDGDRVWGIIKTAISSDGHAESPITNPSKLQLQSLIQKACSKAKIDPHIIQYVECHGTGTAAGDPAEAWGVGSVIGQKKKQKGLPAIPIGSVKTNIGHLESAAGTAGLFKTILMMKHGKLVPSLHSENLNPKIDFEELHVRVSREVCDMGYVDDSKKMRIASVNSNGFGGTAVHSIVQQEQGLVNPMVPAQDGKNLPFLFTAVTRKALKMSILDTVEALSRNEIKSLYQLSHTSTMRRTQYPIRHVSFARSKEELLKSLEFVKHKENVGQRSIEKSGNLVFVFCGMGSHWNKMGERLYAESDVFRNTTNAIQNILDSFEPKVNVLNCFKGHHELSDPFYGQPAIFSIQIGLFEMFKAQQISPNVIVGHSVGEVAAAYCARVLSLEQAVKVIYYRANALRNVAGGAMLVVGKLNIEKVTQLMLQTNSTLDMAAENSPTSCTLSGEKEAISQLEKEILSHYGEGVFLRTLDVKVAYHSKYMDQISNELQCKLHDLQPEMENPHVKIISTVTGKETMRSEMCSATYWQKNVRNGVLFRQAFSRTLSTKGHNIVIEIGPKPVLRSNIKELASEYQYTHLASMMANVETEQFNRTISSCLEVQENISWEQYYTDECPVGDYPRYIFQRKYLYKEPEHAVEWRKGNLSQSDMSSAHMSSVIHPFITKDKEAPSDLVRYVANFTATATPYVFEHKLDGSRLVPGGTYPEIAFAVMSNFHGRQVGNGITIDVDFIRPLVMDTGEESKEATVTLFTEKGKGNIQHEFDVSSGETLHARGIVVIQNKIELCSDSFQIQSIQKRCSKTFDQNHLYDCLSKLNFTYGKSLRWAQNGCMSRREVLVRLEVPDHVNLEETTVHPVFVDSLFQMFALLTSNTNDNQMVPQKLGKFRLLQNQRFVKWAYVKVKSQTQSQIQLDGYLLGADGQVVAVSKEMTVTEMGHDSGVIPIENMFHMTWKHIEELPKVAAMNSAGKHIALFVDGKSKLENETKKWKNCSVYKVERVSEVLLDIEAGHLERCIPVESKLLDCILYGWSLNGALEKSDDGAGIAAEVARVCLDILNVLKSLQSASTQIPLYILVNGLFALQTCSSTDLDLTLNGCLASAIVGMMRTITWEVTLQDYLIIDMDQMSDLSLLQDVISNAASLSAEVAISHKTLHLSQFAPFSPSIEDSSKTLQLASTNKVDLVKSSGKGDGCMLELTNESAKTNVKPAFDDRQELVLDLAFIDNTRSPSSTLSPSNIIAYDLVGHDCEGKRYIALYPVKVTTEKMNVPEANCIPVSTFPSSVPTLSFWVMAWSVCTTAQLSRENVPWIVIGSYEEHPICETIRLLAKDITGSDEADREDANTVIMYINMLDELPNICTELPNCQNLFVITKTASLCEIVQSKLSGGAQLKYNMPVDGILSSALNYFIPSFKIWVNGQDSQRIVRVIDIFTKKFQKDVTCINIGTVRDLGLHDYVVLDLKSESDHFNVRLTEQSLFRQDGSYLIIGGNKGLGFELAQHMAMNGAGRIGILSRSGIQSEYWQILDSIASQHHCEFEEIKADVTNERELHDKTRQFMSSSRFVHRGVFFGAVVLHDQTMANMTEEIFKKVLYPKVAGAWNILNLCRNYNLDFFLLHSSIISMCGNIGQCNYAAANAFLDGLAHYARKVRGTGQSICWGALDLGLLENNQATRMKLASHGMIPMKRHDIVRCFNHALVYNPGVAGYSKFNFPTLTREIRKLPIAAQKIYRWIPNRKGHFVKHSSITASQGIGRGSVDYVKKLVHAITMIDEDDVDMNSSLEYIGADSHQIITIYSQLVKDCGKVPNLSVVDIPLKSLAEIASIIEQESDKMQKVTHGSEPVKSKLDTAHQESLHHDSNKARSDKYVPEPQNDSLDFESRMVNSVAKEVEKVHPSGQGHCNGSIDVEAMKQEIQNKVITNAQNPTTAEKNHVVESPMVKSVAKKVEKAHPPGQGHCNGSIEENMKQEFHNKVSTNAQNPTSAKNNHVVESPMIKSVAKKVEKVHPPGQGHLNGSIEDEAMEQEIQNKVITNGLNSTTVKNQVEEGEKHRDGEDVTLDHMKHGACVYVGTKFSQAKISVCEKHGSFIVTVKGADVNSMHDIKSIVKADVKRVSVKNEELYRLRLQWANEKLTKMYSDNASLLKGWKEGLMILKTRVLTDT